MKIVNLNEYNEGEGLRNKLRPKIDNFEPELPASLWDRIHHEMDVRENTRKKRAIWWFSSVAVVLLTCGVVGFLLVNNASRPIELVIHQPQEIAPVQNGIKNPVPQSNSQSETSVNTPSTTGTSKPANRNGGNGNTNSPILGAINTPNGDLNTSPTIETPGSTTLTDNTPIVEEPTTYTKETILGGGTMEMKAGKLPVVIPAMEMIFVKTTKGLTILPKPTKMKRFFVGMYGEYNQTYRNVVTTSEIFGYPTANERSKFEKKGYSPSYGIEVGYFPLRNLFIKSGIGMFSITENVGHDVYKRKNPQLSVISGDPYDSIVTGSKFKTKNTYSYVQIPFEVGYTSKVNKNWGVLVSGGVCLNILKDYKYNFFEPIYNNVFLQFDKNNSSYFKNFIAVSGNIGTFYKLGNNWQVTGGVMYRRAVTSSSPSEFAVSVKPWSLGARAGLAYTF